MMVTSLLGVSTDAILNGLDSFKGLSHRMEYVGIFHGIHWYNDSIATIPEACMAAVNAIPEVETLILGGFDRGISYDALAEFLTGSGVKTFILSGDAGKRIGESLEKAIKKDKTVLYIHRFDDFFPLALAHTRKGAACLLSPAASSYDEFRSFEERGFRYTGAITGEPGETKTNG
jgi:UDP-N-acetylmuramoyl-L-alanine---L-glutamate ligase